MTAWPKRQRGVALLVALLVVALAVILIAGLLDRGELALARTRNGLRAEQAEAYAQGLEAYAAQVLVLPQVTGEADTNVSPWALPLPPQAVPGGMIGATMRDLNGCFNLNNLDTAKGADPRWKPIFRNLVKVLGIQDDLLDPIQDWLGSADSNGDDVAYYSALPVPYRPRHDVFVHVSELRLVRGVSADTYARLAPYVCALPVRTLINVNTASVPVLQSLGDNLGAAAATALWSGGRATFQGVDEFVTAARNFDPGVGTRSSLLSVRSTYFLARGSIVLDDVPFTFYSLIEHQIGAGGGIHVLERSRGGDDALLAAAPIAGSKDGALQ